MAGRLREQEQGDRKNKAKWAIGFLGVVGFEKAEGGDLHDEEEGLPADDRTAVDGCVAIENVGVLGSLMCVEMFFFPFVGGGHQIPMIDTARVFAPHGAKSTITATPNSAPLFQNFILRDQQIGHQISIHALRLPRRRCPARCGHTSTGSLTSVSGVLNSENEGTLEFFGAEMMGVDDGSVSMVKKFLERCEMRRS
ncbi:hypothetical protein FH972_010702 [Carpinus fangiana]|uniref:Uncharacterized protein n=1 Tax=Carpinus fangiana TaxID=176857 RepID=A0A660KW26_9ROSI|nr:hypothetical protein FH972_010702 [Carpinus fangiana]